MLWPLWSRRACFGTFSAFALCSSGSLPLLVVYGPNKRLFSLLFLSLLIGPFNVYPFLFGHDLVTFWVILDTRLVTFCAEEMNEIAYEYIITTVLQLMLIILLEATRFRVFCTRSYVFGRFLQLWRGPVRPVFPAGLFQCEPKRFAFCALFLGPFAYCF
jgi:hypothetical protein